MAVQHEWRVGAVAFLLILFWVLFCASAGAEGPVPVSPGRKAGMAVVSGRCPAFHWTAVEGAESVELVVYRVPKEKSEGQLDQVLLVTLPGSANGWTPSLGQCLEPSQRYAWSIRAQGEWSEASLFEVSCSIEVGELQPPVRRGLENRELMA